MWNHKNAWDKCCHEIQHWQGSHKMITRELRSRIFEVFSESAEKATTCIINRLLSIRIRCSVCFSLGVNKPYCFKFKMKKIETLVGSCRQDFACGRSLSNLPVKYHSNLPRHLQITNNFCQILKPPKQNLHTGFWTILWLVQFYFKFDKKLVRQETLAQTVYEILRWIRLYVEVLWKLTCKTRDFLGIFVYIGWLFLRVCLELVAQESREHLTAFSWACVFRVKRSVCWQTTSLLWRR